MSMSYGRRFQSARMLLITRGDEEGMSLDDIFTIRAILGLPVTANMSCDVTGARDPVIPQPRNVLFLGRVFSVAVFFVTH